jgi:predicted PurR-regulated permease PerM
LGGSALISTQGALGGGMFWILGIPSAALWGIVAVVVSVLPVVGAAEVWEPGAVYLFFSLLGGLQVFGVLGIVLGPVFFAIAAAILDDFSDETATSGGASPGSLDPHC